MIMICNCRNCGEYTLDEGEARAVRSRLKSLMDPPTCPRCDDEISNSSFQDIDDPSEDDERPRRKLTRFERLQGLADMGIDTLEEYRDYAGEDD